MPRARPTRMCWMLARPHIDNREFALADFDPVGRGVVMLLALLALFAACGRVDFAPATRTPPADAALPIAGGWSTPMPVPGASSALDEDDGSMSPSGKENRVHPHVEPDRVPRARVDRGPVRPDADRVRSGHHRRDGDAALRGRGHARLHVRRHRQRRHLPHDPHRPRRDADVESARRGTRVRERPEPRGQVVLDVRRRHPVLRGARRRRHRRGHLRGRRRPAADRDRGAVDRHHRRTSPFPLPDCNTLYFASRRVRRERGRLYVAQRADLGSPWGTPIRLDDIDDPTAVDEDTWISADGHTLVFASDRGGSMDLYTATRWRVTSESWAA